MFVCMLAVEKSALAAGGLSGSWTEGRERALKVSEKALTGVQVKRNSSEISRAKLEAEQSLIMMDESVLQ